MKTTVGYSVVLPPSYESGEQRYPVVYWLHGGGGNECSSLFTSNPWLDLCKTEQVREVILVYPNGFRSGYMDHYGGKVIVVQCWRNAPESVLNNDAGRPSRFVRFTTAVSVNAKRTAVGFATCSLRTTTVWPSIRAAAG